LIQTPLDYTVRTTTDHWSVICSKHPEIGDLLVKVQECLHDPSVVRRSKIDMKVNLFYKECDQYWLACVAKRLNGVGFLITAYITDRIKEGEQLWQR
jgi:hypothetical protein